MIYTISNLNKFSDLLISSGFIYLEITSGSQWQKQLAMSTLLRWFNQIFWDIDDRLISELANLNFKGAWCSSMFKQDELVKVDKL